MWISWTAKKTNEGVINKAGVNRKLLYSQSKEASILWSHHEETPSKEDHAWPGWTTSRRGQDSPWKSQSE